MHDVKEISLKNEASSRSFPRLRSGCRIVDFQVIGPSPDFHIKLTKVSWRETMSVVEFFKVWFVAPSTSFSCTREVNAEVLPV